MQDTVDLTQNRFSYLIPISIIAGLFFVFGFVTWLNGALIPFLQIACELTQTQALMVTFVFYIAYTIMALPVSLVLNRFGYKNSLVIGLLVMSIGALIFLPAATTREYGIFLFGLFVLGTGLTIMQTAANPYIVLIGPSESAAGRISIMGLLNKSAGIVAPILFTSLVLSDIHSFSASEIEGLPLTERAMILNELSSRLITPYLIMAGMLVVLAAYIKFSPLPEIVFDKAETNNGETSSVLKRPKLVLGVVALFFYVGAEVIAGDTIGLFGRELGVENFTSLTAYTMAFMMLGYAVAIFAIPRLISQQNALAASALLGIVLTFLIAQADLQSHQIWLSLFAWTGAPSVPNAILLVAVFGFANAFAWPAIWPLALEGLSAEQTSIGSAMLIMGISGGAIIPAFFGLISDGSADPRVAYWLMLPCYLAILYYATHGHRLVSWSKTKA